MFLDMIKKITGQNRHEEVPMDVLQVLCDLQTLQFEPPLTTSSIEQILNAPITEIDESVSFLNYKNCKIYLYTFPLFDNNVYLGDHADRISISTIHQDTKALLTDEPPKDLMEAFQDRVSFLKAARLLALENQNTISRCDPGYPKTELDIEYLTNF